MTNNESAIDHVSQVIDLFGDPRLCNESHVTVSFSHRPKGWTWEIDVDIAQERAGGFVRCLRPPFSVTGATWEEALGAARRKAESQLEKIANSRPKLLLNELLSYGVIDAEEHEELIGRT